MAKLTREELKNNHNNVMTIMENRIMQMTDCDRTTANLVANEVLDLERDAEKILEESSRKREISKIGKEMLLFQSKMAEKYNYKPIPIDLFMGNIRDKYEEALPSWCLAKEKQNCPLYSSDGTMICTGFDRIVIGDYGAFIEISPNKICSSSITCKKGQEYRSQDKKFADRVKYLWLTTKDASDCKIYLQKKTVAYADYVPGMYYISPYEVFLTKEGDI